MTIIPGPRPLAIRVFAAAFLAAAAIRLGQGLADIERAAIGLAMRAPWFGWDRDWTIIALSAEFTIALIPIAWIYLFAAPFARWLVLGFGALKLWGLRLPALFALQSGSIAPLSLTEPALVLMAMVSLLTVGANHWFAQRKENGPAVFE
jgi:hypothetical protein